MNRSRMPRSWMPTTAMLLVALLAVMTTAAAAFAVSSTAPMQRQTQLFSGSSDEAKGEIVARRITVQGDVQGGYYRSCVRNEGGRFRRLTGTMSEVEEGSDTAEIYVEGKRKMVEGFIRWCKKGDVGLSQQATVVNVVEEEPVGLYDDFYVKTK